MSVTRIGGLWHPDPPPPVGITTAPQADSSGAASQPQAIELKGVDIPHFKKIRISGVVGREGTYVLSFFDEKIEGDEKDIRQFKTELGNLLMKEYDYIKKLVWDFNGVKSISPEAASMLYSVKSSYGAYISLRLCNVNPEVLRAFDKVQVVAKLDIKSDLANALEGF